MESLSRQLWHLPYRLAFLGVNIGRNVTVIRLDSGDLVVHSTAPFTPEDVAAVRELGRVRWITDPMLDHNTFSGEGMTAFPEATYLVPDGFSAQAGEMKALLPAPPEWAGELEVLPIHGVPGFGEHVFYHVSSRTLIVCDLLMHFPGPASAWKRLLLWIGLGRHQSPGISRRFKMAVRNRHQLRQSLDEIMKWDIEMVICGHGQPMRLNARNKLKKAFEQAGWM